MIAHSMPTQCPLNAHSMPTQCPLNAHSMPTQCPLIDHLLPTAATAVAAVGMIFTILTICSLVHRCDRSRGDGNDLRLAPVSYLDYLLSLLPAAPAGLQSRRWHGRTHRRAPGTRCVQPQT